MNMENVYKQITNELSKETKKFDNSQDPFERHQCVQNYARTIAFAEGVLQAETRDFYRNCLQELLCAAHTREELMRKDVKKICKPLTEAGDKQTITNRDDQMGQGLFDTILSEKPNVHWDDIAGLEEAKKSLQEALILPLKYPNFFNGNVQPWKGILLYGPPGTGKTYLAKACATECKATFFAVSSSDLMSKYLGESEKLVRELFKTAREHAPAIIFIDEVDALCGARSEGENESSRRVKSEFLVQIAGINEHTDRVLFLGATNLPWTLDPAVRRRFERRVYIPLPNYQGRLYFLKRRLKGLDDALEENDLSHVAQSTEGYSCADLEILLRDAAFEPLALAQRTDCFQQIYLNGKHMYSPLDPSVKSSEVYFSDVFSLPPNSLHLPHVTRKDIFSALKRNKPSVSTKDLFQYEEWTRQFGMSD